MKKNLTPYILLLPQIFLTAILIASVVTCIFESMGVIKIFGLEAPTLSYYKEILSKPSTVNGILYSLRISLISSAIAVAIGVFLACIFLNNNNIAFSKLIQLPIIIPHIAVTIFLINILSQNGLLSRLAYWLGFLQEQQQFPTILYDKFGFGVIIGYLWKEIPFIIFIVISIMSNINKKLGEAALNLGASKLKVFTKILIPLSKNTIISGFLIIFIFSLGAYELPALLGSTTPKALPVLAYESFLHPDLQNRPYAMALNGIIILISLICSIIYYLSMKNHLKQINDNQRGNL